MFLPRPAPVASNCAIRDERTLLPHVAFLKVRLCEAHALTIGPLP
jgi:hypothetical protein